MRAIFTVLVCMLMLSGCQTEYRVEVSSSRLPISDLVKGELDVLLLTDGIKRVPMPPDPSVGYVGQWSGAIGSRTFWRGQARISVSAWEHGEKVVVFVGQENGEDGIDVAIARRCRETLAKHKDWVVVMDSHTLYGPSWK